LPIYIDLPLIKKKIIVCAPLLEKINLRKYLSSSILNIGGQQKIRRNARICDYNRILDIKNQYINCSIDCYFKQTGTYLKGEVELIKYQRKSKHYRQKQV
jgi:hypothetical protein